MSKEGSVISDFKDFETNIDAVAYNYTKNYSLDETQNSTFDYQEIIIFLVAFSLSIVVCFIVYKTVSKDFRSMTRSLI